MYHVLCEMDMLSTVGLYTKKLRKKGDIYITLRVNLPYLAILIMIHRQNYLS